mmetsp:Transcript_44927/g.124954  ORF Transcript_44927/g.124954 Transcript_44927/m.124954 type:complete len:214 (+) Transcript_44927:291-932(+)
MSGGMSSSSSSSSSPSSSSACAPAATAASFCRAARCMEKRPLRFLALFFALRQRFFLLALRLATASGSWASSPTGGLSAKPKASRACIELDAYGSRMLCSEVSRLWSLAWLSGGNTWKATVSFCRITVKYGPLVKSTLMHNLMSSSIIEMCIKMFGTSQTLRIISESRNWGRKTLMLKVTTTKVCSVDFKFCHSIMCGPHVGLSYSAGRMLRT